MARAVRDRDVRIVLDGRNLNSLARKRAPDVRRDAFGVELRIAQHIILRDLLESDTPEFFPRSIDAHSLTIGSENLNAERRLFHEGAEARFAFANCLLGSLALGDVLDHRHEANHPAIERTFRNVDAVHPPLPNFLVRDYFFE